MLCKQRWWQTTIDARYEVNWIGLQLSILQVAVTFTGWWYFIYSILLSQIVVFDYTSDPWNQPGWEKETLIIHILPCFVTCSNSHTSILDTCSHSYASMTFTVIYGIECDIWSNPTRTISCMKGSTNRDMSQKLCVYNIAAWLNRRPGSWAVTVIASYWAPCPNIFVLLRIHAPVNDCYWSNQPTSPSVLEDICAGIQLARELTLCLWEDDLPSLADAWRLKCMVKLTKSQGCMLKSIVVIAVMTTDTFCSLPTIFRRRCARSCAGHDIWILLYGEN